MRFKQFLHSYLFFLLSLSLACGSKKIENPEFENKTENKPGPFAGKIWTETLNDLPVFFSPNNWLSMTTETSTVKYNI